MNDLKKSKIVFFRRLHEFIIYYDDIDYEDRKIEWKHTKQFNFVNNIRTGKTFNFIVKPPFASFLLNNKKVIVENKTCRSIVEEVISIIIPQNTKMSIGENLKSIQDRKVPNDNFTTPLLLAKKHISLIDAKEDDVWLDPCRGTSWNYYNHFPQPNRLWCEINNGRDFLTSRAKPSIICGNPPYSKITLFLKQAIKMKPRVISYLVGNLNMTGNRFQLLKDNHYHIARIHYVNVKKWFGMSAIIVWDKTATTEKVSWDTKTYS